jgi:hypothetical protein
VVLDDGHGSNWASDDVLLLFSKLTSDGATKVKMRSSSPGSALQSESTAREAVEQLGGGRAESGRH